MFKLEKQGAGCFHVNTNKRTIGEIYKEVDGCYVFAFVDIPTGCFSEDFFAFVNRSLTDLNAEYVDGMLIIF